MADSRTMNPPQQSAEEWAAAFQAKFEAICKLTSSTETSHKSRAATNNPSHAAEAREPNNNTAGTTSLRHVEGATKGQQPPKADKQSSSNGGTATYERLTQTHLDPKVLPRSKTSTPPAMT
ncbi:Hypothetical predicted protein [Pelobates cultripes]|uniref:Uncharacterized protein n=1 Tax=Pelobates cultripes TaxID=61616 RepID=A0AAD1WTX7_PELCU|nr:Hypothetical predicted protein [Pelobates cultripes]CAH2322216.1 Hypothetical predicted protein [Pelobates cultripes]